MRMKYFSLLILMFSSLATLCSTSVFAQVIEAKGGDYIAAMISATSINRITLEDDRIKVANKSDPSFVLETDGATGDLYLKFLKDANPKIIEFFIISEKGHTYHLSLTPRKQPGQTVTIRNTEISKSAARAFEAKTPYKEGVATLFKAMITRSPLNGYEVRKDKASFKAGEDLYMLRTSVYEGEAIAGAIFTVTNNSESVVTLDESKFKKNGVIGVSISTNKLGPKESLTLYLVERRG